MRWFVLVALAATGCSERMAPPEMLPCDGVVTNVPNEAGIHVTPGTQIQWSTNPPATGMHYPVWAQWDRHYMALDRGYWLHNAEHGGVVLLYNCPNGCADVVDSLIGVVKGFASDTACHIPARNRLLVVADPMLPAEVQVAAVAWDVTYTASCFDPYIVQFAREHYNHAPEDLCDDGVDMGGTLIQ